MTRRRLIEEAFPLRKVSEDSKHEKNVRHGHISTLHIWPARRPLAACRAAAIAVLMPDPGDERGRDELIKKIESITHWGTENGPALDFFRQEIRKAYGGRAPRVLDMFAGGGAIPLEAMRLGCEVIANDYNPVAWFILKCTLEFPQRLAGKKWRLPKPDGERTAPDAPAGAQQMPLLGDQEREGDLAAHVRWWGNWVLERARAEIAPYYPTVNGQPTVAYLWARTVPCPDPACGAEVPLLKTLSLCEKDGKRRALRLIPDPANHQVRFEVFTPGLSDDVSAATMAGAKAQCPLCGVSITSDYIKACGFNGELRARMTAVVVETGHGKEYRLPTEEEERMAGSVQVALASLAREIPHGLPCEVQQKNPRTLISQLYGMTTWADLFTPRQLLALMTYVRWTRAAGDEMERLRYPPEWAEALSGYLACTVDKSAQYTSTICTWHITGEKMRDTFARFAIQMTWDYAELAQANDVGGGYAAQLDWIVRYVQHALNAAEYSTSPQIYCQSATEGLPDQVDVILTDPPYYNSIPYADLSDFFYVWLRRSFGDRYSDQFGSPTTNKAQELALRLPHAAIPDEHTPEWYEHGMGEAFRRACDALTSDGRMVVVFAHKEPTAWQTLVTAMIKAGFTVTASWPIDTEMGNRTRAMDSAALSSSIWMVCRKRPARAGVGRYAAVRRAMQERITERLRYFWDIGISGPDFIWAAVGPALESYSSYDEVRRLDGSLFTVGEFLREVRRMVADFALGQILGGRTTEGLDEWTRYYLIHRNAFGMEDAPVGECILLSQGYGLDLNDLRGPRGLLTRASSSDVRLARWDERSRTDLGEAHPSGGLPLIDMLHRLMWLWAAGDVGRVRTYAADHGLSSSASGGSDLFWSIAQAVLEMPKAGSRERSLLEALVAWGRGVPVVTAVQPELPGGLEP